MSTATSDDYYNAPELGLYGRWPLDVRLNGLAELLRSCRGKRVLDLGAAEGLISREFLKHGASLVHGFEIDEGRVSFARQLCAPFGNATFRIANLANWDSFIRSQAEGLQDSYDIVLYLGIQHHLPLESRQFTLMGALRLAGNCFAFRAPASCYQSDQIVRTVTAAGFSVTQTVEARAVEDLGMLTIFKRDRI